MPEQEATFLGTPADWRDWLEAQAADATELWVGFFRHGAEEGGITWPEAVDQARCFGWIDGRQQSIDDRSYRIRFAPGKPRSGCITVCVARVAELEAAGSCGRRGSRRSRRRPERSGRRLPRAVRAAGVLEAGAEALLRQRPEAWKFFFQAPSYRKAALCSVVDAKRPETRARRLATLIDDSAEGRRIGHL